MTVLLFVHGTSVRESGHDATVRAIRGQVAGLGRGWTVETCYWGTVLGAELNEDGASVPTYNATRRSTETGNDDGDVALWSVLYTDPLYELRILGLKSVGPAPFGMSPSEALLQKMRSFVPSEQTRDFFHDLGLSEFLSQAIAAVTTSTELVEAANTADADPVEHRQAIARAIVAETLMRSLAADAPAVSGWVRDKLVANLSADLRADVMGIPDWLKKAAGKLVARIATPALLDHRGSLTDALTPGVGDILRFLAHPGPVIDYITTRINDLTDPDLYLLGHSLGGIMCVDLLARRNPPHVSGLITIGSQAPYFQEIGALPALTQGASLPNAMPPWLNIYDPRDILSYTGEGIFGSRVTDIRTDSQQPFPYSHSAYFTNPAVWTAVSDFIQPPSERT